MNQPAASTHSPIPPTGIASIGVSLPSLALPVEELARLRGQDPNKYLLGLGCREMALCPPGTRRRSSWR